MTWECRDVVERCRLLLDGDHRDARVGLADVLGELAAGQAVRHP